MVNYADNSKITYPQLVMDQIKKLQEICSKELKDGNKIIKNLIGEQTIEGEDTRYSFIQSVEMFGSLLSNYFPEEKKGQENVVTHFNDFCDLLDMELSEALEDEEFKGNVKKVFNLSNKQDIKKEIEENKLTNEVNVYFLNLKVKEARKMFRELVKLFKDHDFLTEESYGDTGGSSQDNGMEADGDDEDLIE
jgi:hypothetical protein